ncbi:restriction endonuclease subunit S [Lactobacillus delbrueckii subsp. lactis]|uniref:restriction endonuclease subunit S n=1 Tax=Lactobacillus delbrueckii TaxID=1584 RepID=UPI001E6101D5|nr:restriction endonuclease subunit S [Lactobacillus delbrueckii]MCD5434496.1 restriction endonuclease subunit S [Lactobacillus delbrueckii subsp. lactis]
MKDEKKAPKLRFKGFTDDWEQRKLGDVCEEVSGNNGNVKGLPILTISAANGWMNQKDRFSQVIAGNELKKYTLLEKGHLAYNHGNSKLAKYGTVFVQNLYDQALVPRVYHSFKMKTENNPYYVEYYFATKKLDRELARLVTSGARMDGLLNINKKDFFKIKFEVPTPVEQSLISTILQKLDQIITLHEEKKCLLERLKSVLSQEMFANKNGYPAVRFEGFDKAWKQSKLGEITKVIAAKPYISTPSTHGNYLVIQQGDKPIAGFSNSNPFKNYNNITLFGDHTLSLFKPRSPFLVASDGIKILSPSIEMNGLFYFYELEKYKPKSEGYKRHFTILKKCKANFPTDIDEQKLIGSLLLHIDNLITKQQLKMDKLNETKESLLQNMFI